MSTVPNHTLRQLRAGKLAIGLGLRQARTVDTAQIAKTCGYDWLFIDCEHNSMDLDTAAQIAAGSLAVGITPIARVAGFEHWHASRMLDNGAQGIVFPHVDTASDGFLDNTRLFLPPTAYNRFAVTREINDGLLAPRFAPSQRGWVLQGSLVSQTPVVPASSGRDADDR